MAEPTDPRELHIAEEPHLEVWSVRRSRIAKPQPPAQSWAQLEPHAWLVVGAQPGIESAHPFLVTDLSDRFTAFRICGEKAADLLAAASSAALPSVLKVGGCVRTRFAEEVEVVLQRLAEREFRLLIDASLARFAAAWLRAASAGG